MLGVACEFPARQHDRHIDNVAVELGLVHVGGRGLGVGLVGKEDVGGASVGVGDVADGQVKVDNVAELAKDFVEVVLVDVCCQFLDNDLYSC